MENEKRLIDANELLRDAEDYGPIRGGLADMYDVKWLVDAQITVDAVEVVRCKDCKHFVQGEPYDPCECMKWMVKWGVAYTTPDGYCHKGERRPNDG